MWWKHEFLMSTINKQFIAKKFLDKRLNWISLYFFSFLIFSPLLSLSQSLSLLSDSCCSRDILKTITTWCDVVRADCHCMSYSHFFFFFFLAPKMLMRILFFQVRPGSLQEVREYVFRNSWFRFPFFKPSKKDQVFFFFFFFFLNS